MCGVIHFFIGTKAQFIKTAPLIIEARARRLAFRVIDSGQHSAMSATLRRVFNLPEPDVSLARGGDIASVTHALRWFAKLNARGFFDRRWLREQVFPGGGICVIHGDTLSTLLGLRLARRAGLRVAHVEAGLRSGHAFEPFPEELIRRWCMRRADVLFAPSDEAAANLAHARGEVINIHANTVVDALRLINAAPAARAPFALATCHRIENISSRRRLAAIVALVNRSAQRMPTVFVLHEPTARALAQSGLCAKLDPRVETRPLTDYAEFVGLLKASALVLTDGGSIQEECAALGKPCLILRKATERTDGLGANARLWKFSEKAAEEFLASPPAAPPVQTDLSPSKIILDCLEGAGYGI